MGDLAKGILGVAWCNLGRLSILVIGTEGERLDENKVISSESPMLYGPNFLRSANLGSKPG
jgi:hypothetical protein